MIAATPEILARRKEKDSQKKARIERDRAAMKYRGLITIDYTHSNDNQYQKLLAALIQTGWVYLETSALLIESDLPTILHSLELITRQCQDGGVLSALTIQVQGSKDFAGISYRGAKNHPHAVRDILTKPLPKPKLG